MCHLWLALDVDWFLVGMAQIYVVIFDLIIWSAENHAKKSFSSIDCCVCFVGFSGSVPVKPNGSMIIHSDKEEKNNYRSMLLKCKYPVDVFYQRKLHKNRKIHYKKKRSWFIDDDDCIVYLFIEKKKEKDSKIAQVYACDSTCVHCKCVMTVHSKAFDKKKHRTVNTTNTNTEQLQTNSSFRFFFRR